MKMKKHFYLKLYILCYERKQPYTCYMHKFLLAHLYTQVHVQTVNISYVFISNFDVSIEKYK